MLSIDDWCATVAGKEFAAVVNAVSIVREAVLDKFHVVRVARVAITENRIILSVFYLLVSAAVVIRNI